MDNRRFGDRRTSESEYSAAQPQLWELALACVERKDYRAAVTLLVQALNAEPDSIPLRSLLAETYFWLGRFDACRKCILLLQQQGVDTALGQVALAALDIADGDWQEAVDHLLAAEELLGNDARLAANIARLYLRLQRSADAARVLDEALAANANSTDLHEAQSLALLLSRDFAAAEAEARKAVCLDPNSFVAAYRHGVTLQRLNRPAEAVSAFQNALALAPRYASVVHRRLADSFHMCGLHALAFHHRALSARSTLARGLPGLNLDWPDQFLPIE